MNQAPGTMQLTKSNNKTGLNIGIVIAIGTESSSMLSSEITRGSIKTDQ